MSPYPQVTYVVVKGFLSTRQLAREVGVNRITLQKWIRTGKVNAPSPVIRNGRAVRLWSPAKVRKVRERVEGNDQMKRVLTRAKAEVASIQARRKAERQAKLERKARDNKD